MYSNNRVGVFHEDRIIGEMEIYPSRELQQQQQQEDDVMKQRKKKQREVMEKAKMGIRISHFSQSSDRCPLAVLTTISSFGLCFKLEASSSLAQESLSLFYSSCLRETKAAVVLLGKEELHLVDMYSENCR